jgi:hypothetical protein
MDHLSEPPPPNSPRLRRIAISFGCVAIGVIGGLMVFVWTTARRPPPAMSAADFNSAVVRWRANRPTNYAMTVEVTGQQQGTMHVVVENNEPKLVERNGVAASRHTWPYWTIDGMFEIIRNDLENLDQPERAFGTEDVSQLVQQADFDDELGYPRRYRRAVKTTGDAIEWEITRFDVE